MTGDSEAVDVAVVGAGISGLHAARLLCDQARSVAVFESRDRVGGRLLSAASLDLGATWFWPDEHRVMELVDELGVETFDQYLDGDAMYQDSNGTRRIDGNPIDVPCFRFTHGADALPIALADRLPAGTVRLRSPVTRVAGTGPLSVEYAGGVVHADHVVLAVPPALAVSRIEFEPGLPERFAALAAMTPVWMGATVKVVARYPAAFWRDRGLSGSAISHIGPMRELHDMSGPDGEPAAIFGFVPNITARPTPTDEQLRAQLGDLFGPEAASPEELIIMDWRAEAATSPPGAERLQAFQLFGHDGYQSPGTDRRLHWVSTETARVAPGHIEGALAAAERAVVAIIADVHLPNKPESTNP